MSYATPTMPEIPVYGIQYLVLPQIVMFDSRETYTAKTGRQAGAPDYGREPQMWVDADAIANPGKYSRRIVYQNILATHDNGKLVMRPVSEVEGLSDEQKAFYADYGITEIPIWDEFGIQLLKTQVTEPNIPHGGANVDPAGWSRTSVPLPMRRLLPGEAWQPALFATSGVKVVNIALYRKLYPPQGAPDRETESKIDEILRLVREIAAGK